MTDNEDAKGLLCRLTYWDHMKNASDGVYWLGEINKVLSKPTLTPDEEDAIQKAIDRDPDAEILKNLLERFKTTDLKNWRHYDSGMGIST